MTNSHQADQQELVNQALLRGYGVVYKDSSVDIIDQNSQVVSSFEFSKDEGPDWEELIHQLQKLYPLTVLDEEAAKITRSDVTDILTIYTDGGSRGNPGPSAAGYVIFDSNGRILEEGGEYLGITTNNQAEYQAVKIALETAAKYKASEIKFNIDSLLVVNQMNGVYKIKNRDLWPIHTAIRTLADDYKSVEFTHVRRELNKLADQKVNEVLDAHADSEV